MTITSQKMTLEEYLNYDDGTDTQYVLENGELVVMPPESDLNRRIASLLFAFFLQQGIPPYRLRIGTEIVVSGSRATTRFPDLMVLSEELATALEGARRSTVMLDMPPPILVVEVVSPDRAIETIVTSAQSMQREALPNIGLLIQSSKKLPFWNGWKDCMRRKCMKVMWRSPLLFWRH